MTLQTLCLGSSVFKYANANKTNVNLTFKRKQEKRRKIKYSYLCSAFPPSEITVKISSISENQRYTHIQ